MRGGGRGGGVRVCKGMGERSWARGDGPGKMSACPINRKRYYNKTSDIA